MMNFSMPFALLGLILFATTGFSSRIEAATVITFEGFAPDDNRINVNPAAPYTESEFILSVINDRSAVFGPDAEIVQLQGASSAWFGFSEENLVTLTGPGVFNIHSIDVGISTGADTTVTNVSLSGFRQGQLVESRVVAGVSVLQSIELNWTGIDRAEISSLDDVGIDNINVSTVPEPASGGLMVIALGGLLWRRRESR